MWAISALIISCLTSTAVQAGSVCEGDGNTLTEFNGAVASMRLPCKYHAVKQKCGNYFVNISPGNEFIHPEYYVDSLWVGLRNRQTKQEWEGTFSNTAAYKYLTGARENLFNKKGGAMDTRAFLTEGKDETSIWVEAKTGDFRILFTPTEPDVPGATWRFECLVEFEEAPFPTQICGGGDGAIDLREEELNLYTREQTIFYDIFNKTEIAQTNGKCEEATRLMTQVCNEEQRRMAMVACSQILFSHRDGACDCVSKGTCDRMDVFLECMNWACSGFVDDATCDSLGLFTLVDSSLHIPHEEAAPAAPGAPAA